MIEQLTLQVRNLLTKNQLQQAAMQNTAHLSMQFRLPMHLCLLTSEAAADLTIIQPYCEHLQGRESNTAT